MCTIFKTFVGGGGGREEEEEGRKRRKEVEEREGKLKLGEGLLYDATYVFL